MPVRVAVDAMGGDHAPRVVVRGALAALSQDADLEVVLVGDEARITSELAQLEEIRSHEGATAQEQWHTEPPHPALSPVTGERGLKPGRPPDSNPGQDAIQPRATGGIRTKPGMLRYAQHDNGPQPDSAQTSGTLTKGEMLRGAQHDSGGAGHDAGGMGSRLRIVHASQVIPMDAAPVDAIRSYKDSSLVRMAELGASGEVDAVVSAGNTGACAAVAQLKMKPLACVTRPGIAVTIPSFHGPFVLCDVGANIQAKPRHLYEYAVMAALYAERVVGIAKPRVALMSIGEESGKGTALVKRTSELIQGDRSLNFVGNAEGRELFENRCDVAISDGFVGNIVLKFVEGLAEGLFRTIAREFEDEDAGLKTKFAGALDRVWRRHDYSRYGGAPLLGVNGVCIICHGRSNEFAICNAINAARQFVEQKYNEALVARLEQHPRQD